ncbi:MAG: mismatch endonuclease Vsr [Bacteroidota bacterium]
MSRIRSSNTKPELLVRKFLFACGYKINVKKMLCYN